MWPSDILRLFELVLPQRMAARENGLDGVAKLLQPDAQPMPGGRCLPVHRARMQPAQGEVPLECRTLCRRAVRRHQTAAPTEHPSRSPPGLPVERLGRLCDPLPRLGFALPQRLDEARAHGGVSVRQLLDPFFEDLQVAQFTQRVKQPAYLVRHPPPCRMGIDLLHDGADGTAAPDGDAQIVDGFGIR